jgi:hypothetical protein
MPTWAWIVIVAAVVVVLVVVAMAVATRARRTRQLRQGFGPEYDRTVEAAGGKREGEQELDERRKRHEALDLRPLSPAARSRYAEQWEATQVRFVDDPGGAVGEADALVQRVMSERGYPTDTFEQRAADVSVEHPQLVERYRTARGIAKANERGEASTEDLRQSVRHYRALFEELLSSGGADEPLSRDTGSDREEAEAQRGDAEARR